MSRNVIVYDQDPVFLNWINKELDIKLDPSDTRTIAHVRFNDDDSATILCVVAMNRWCTHSVELSIASTTPRWATWNFIHEVYEYVFSTCEKERINFIVEVTNSGAINMHDKLGHIREGTLRDLFGAGHNCYIYGFTRTDYLASPWFVKQSKKTKGHSACITTNQSTGLPNAS